ncbi:MAG: low molecular weight protein arginine phosphatase [Firmicutes bacterium]|jgi:protein-tyrosine-phosphatase|nr:low molecular weight protein arginine phosphatase [Bacillota bacterium]
MNQDYLMLFVCTGNTCRSPMAEGLWRQLLGGRAESCGVSAWAGAKATRHAVAAVTRYGVDLSDHRARNLEEVTNVPDFVVTMTRDQACRVVEQRPEWADRTYVLSELAGESGDILDPIGQNLEQYERVADEIYRLLVKVKDRLDREDIAPPQGPENVPRE